MTRYESISDEVFEFIDELSADDVGKLVVGDYLVRFEGFGELCWDHASERDMSICGLEDEIIADWSARSPERNLIEFQWINEPVAFEPTLFWAVFR